MFNLNIAQSAMAKKLTGNHTSLLTGNNVSPGKTHIVNPAIAIKLLDKAVPEFINTVATAVILTNERVGFVADRFGQATGIDIG